jgi:hypothetical protein
MQRKNHFLKKLVKKITNKGMEAGLKKVQRDAEKHIGKEAAKDLITDLKEKADNDPAFQKKLNQINNIGTAAVATAAILGAGAAIAPAAGIGGAGAAGAGAGAAGAGGAGAAGAVTAGAGAIGAITKGGKESDLYKSGEVPGDHDKRLLDQLLDNQTLKEKGGELLNRILEGDEDTGKPSGRDAGNNIIDNGNDDRKKLAGFLPTDNITMIVIVVIIILLLVMMKKK